MHSFWVGLDSESLADALPGVNSLKAPTALLPVDPGQRTRKEEARCGDSAPRNIPSMVWESCYHEVLGRTMAQGMIRNLHVLDCCRQVLSAVACIGELCVQYLATCLDAGLT